MSKKAQPLVKKRGPVLKTLLESPFVVSLNTVGERDRDLIFELLKPHIVQIKQRGGKRKRGEHIAHIASAAEPAEPTSVPAPPPVAVAAVDEEKTHNMTELYLGLNAVTRALEKNELRAVVMCKDTLPAIVTDHIPTQCFLTDTPLIVIPGPPFALAHLFRTNTMIALGFAKTTVPSVFDDLVTTLQAIATRLDMPWLLPLKQSRAQQQQPAAQAQAQATGADVQLMPVKLGEHKQHRGLENMAFVQQQQQLAAQEQKKMRREQSRLQQQQKQQLQKPKQREPISK
eukprot:TRINITY_DN8191_c0_g1_i1.p1 TRINITY_DN8191_c0_g1~~TRINITY_DN8191_c0_g1_i1.p1  ORF type:complete len:286 (+),score=90.48 TRINITY_DN8191_c0_g1_i1:89-946(+)